jgi:hypothetical protein
VKPLLNDRLIRDAVLDGSESDPDVSEKHISVTVNNGAVTLAGHVVASLHEFPTTRSPRSSPSYEVGERRSRTRSPQQSVAGA